MKTAPVHNLDFERAVGSVNHELKVRGAKEIKAVSSSLVKAKASNLMEGKQVTKDFKKMTKKGGAVPEIVKVWEEKQAELKRKGMDAKEISNISVDKQRNADLNKLTEVGGPITTPEQVTQFMDRSDVDEKTKNTRLYLEVRFAKNSSLSLPKSSDIFRLKRKGKNLPSKEYSDNLSTYLSKITCTVNMEMKDFREALMTMEKE